MSKNIFEQSHDTAREASRLFTLGTGVVTSANPSRNEVVVNAQRSNEPHPATVPVPESGDVRVPTEGTSVIVGYRPEDQPVVVGVLYDTTDDVPSVEVGERVIGHAASGTEIRFKPNGDIEVSPESDTIVHGNSDTSITLNENGDVELDPENDLVVNGGSTAPVTDVNTTSDGDGHVTSITLVRASNTKVSSN